MSFNVTSVFQLIPERHLFPQMSLFYQIDQIEPICGYYFYFYYIEPASQSLQFFKKISQYKSYYRQELYVFDVSSARQFIKYPTIEYRDYDIAYARWIKNKLVVTRKTRKKAITEFISTDSGYARVISVETPDHYIHQVTDDIFIYYDYDNQLRIGQIKQSFFKPKLIYQEKDILGQQYGPVIYMRGYENFLLAVQQMNVIFIITLLRYDHQSCELKIVSQVTAQKYKGAKSLPEFYYDLQQYPALVIKQDDNFYVVNFYRRELLYIYMSQVCPAVSQGEDYFQTYILSYNNRYDVYLLNGVGIICYFDWMNDKSRVVLFSVTLTYKTKIFYSTVQNLLSYEMYEVYDVFYLGNLFLMAGCQDLYVTTAVKYVMNHIQLFINQYKNKALSYSAIRRSHRHIYAADFIPWDFLHLLRDEKSENKELFVLSDDIITNEGVIDTFYRYFKRAERIEQQELLMKSYTSAQVQDDGSQKEKEARIYPVLFNYQPKGEFAQQIKEIVAAFRQFNPVRTRNRKSFSMLGIDDSDSEYFGSISKYASRTSFDSKRFSSIGNQYKDTLLQYMSLIPCPNMFNKEYKIFTPVSRFMYLPVYNNQNYHKMMVFDFLHYYVKYIEFQLNLFEAEHFNNLITENMVLYSKHDVSEHDKNNSIGQSFRKLNFMKIQSRCFYQSLYQDIVMNTYWRSGMFVKQFELNQSITTYWIYYLNVALNTEMLDTYLTGLLIITKSIVDIYLIIANLYVPGSKVVLMHIAQSVFSLITDNTKSTLISVLHLIDRENSISKLAEVYSVGDFFKLLNNDPSMELQDNVSTTMGGRCAKQLKFWEDGSYGLQLYDYELVAKHQRWEGQYYLPDGDGYLASYSYMPGIFELGVFNAQVTQTFHYEIGHINNSPKYPSYYRQYLVKVNYYGKNEQIRSQLMRLQYYFYHIRYLFYYMQCRARIYSPILNRADHSIIFRSAQAILEYFEQASRPYTSLNSGLVQEMKQQILYNAATYFSITADFIAYNVLDRIRRDGVIRFDELASVLECLELFGVYGQENCRQCLEKFICLCQDAITGFSDEIVPQLFGFGIMG